MDQPKQSGTAGQKPTWRVWLIVGVWAFLLVQGATDQISRAHGHGIFPTIAMPGFSAKNVGTDGRARITEREIQVIGADGRLRPVEVDQLMAPLNSSSAVATLDRIFDPKAKGPPEFSPETVDFLRRQTEQLHSGADPVGLRIAWQPTILDIHSLDKTPEGEPTVREVRW